MKTMHIQALIVKSKSQIPKLSLNSTAIPVSKRINQSGIHVGGRSRSCRIVTFASANKDSKISDALDSAKQKIDEAKKKADGLVDEAKKRANRLRAQPAPLSADKTIGDVADKAAKAVSEYTTKANATIEKVYDGPDFVMIADGPKVGVVAGGWWLYTLAGIAMIAAGYIVVAKPVAAWLTTLAAVCIGSAIYGVTRLVHAIVTFKDNNYWWAEILDGLSSCCMAYFMYVQPHIATLTILNVVMGLLALSGISQLASAVTYPTDCPGLVRASFAASGLATVGVAGCMVYSGPTLELAFVILAIGSSFIFRGIITTLASFGLAFMEKDNIPSELKAAADSFPDPPKTA